jgi:hypothetical protein
MNVVVPRCRSLRSRHRAADLGVRHQVALVEARLRAWTSPEPDAKIPYLARTVLMFARFTVGPAITAQELPMSNHSSADVSSLRATTGAWT